MSSIKILEEALSDCSTIYWVQYSNHLGNNNIDYIFFIEGEEDPIYYPSRLSIINSNKQSSFINCHGKDRVILARDEVKDRYKAMTQSGTTLPKPLFIIDRDLDHYASTPPAVCPYVFETEHYSFESYYINENLFRTIWQVHFRLTLNSEYQLQLSKFTTLCNSAVDLLILASALSLYFKSIDAKLVFSDFKESQLFVINKSTGSITLNKPYAIKKLRKQMKRNSIKTINRDSVSNYFNLLKQEHYLKPCRGKWLLYLMAQLLEAIRVDISAKGLLRAHPQIDVAWMVAHGAPYAQSDDFTEFIMNHENAI